MIDDIDRRIIRVLEREARITNAALGARVGLSPNATGVRVQRLVDRGVITGFGAHLDMGTLGRPMEAIIDCWLRQPDERDPIADLVADDDRVVEAIHITGNVDFRLRVFVESAEDLNDLLTALRTSAGVSQTDTHLVLQRLSTQAAPS